MKVTLKLMSELFDEWNEKAFKGSLKPPTFKISRSKRSLGTHSYRKLRGHTISISSSFDFSLEAIRDVMIHEMIHYYICLNYPRKDWCHGREFKYLMTKINREFGTDIRVKGVGGEREYEGKRQMRMVYAVESPKYGNGFAVITPSYRWKFETAMKSWADISKIRRFETDDPFFDLFAVHRSKCSYTVRKNEYETKLAELVAENNKLNDINRTFWIPCGC